MKTITKLLSLVAFSIMSLGLQSFPVHADLIDTNGDGYPDFECAAPMSLLDGGVGCGDNSTSSSSAIDPNNSSNSNNNSDSNTSNLPNSNCFQNYEQCVDEASSNPSTVRSFTQGLDCAVDVVRCVGKEIIPGRN